MRYRICFIAGIMGLAVISGIIGALAAPREKAKEGEPEAGEGSISVPSG
jgi:hypothetical protein